MIGIYLSGTGNTRYCTEQLMHLLDETGKCIPLEQENAAEELKKHRQIVLGYPTQYSNAPVMVRDFIRKHADIWSGREVFCLTTMGLFSGDGTGCAARILKKYGANIIGGLQIVMPDSIGDCKALKKSAEENKNTVKRAAMKIQSAAQAIKAGHYPQEGLGGFAHIAGLFGQRLWFYKMTQDYSSRLKINDTCVGCGKCVMECPMHNLTMVEGRPQAAGQCTMCYRCVSQCPQQAITLLGNKIVMQSRVEKYL